MPAPLLGAKLGVRQVDGRQWDLPPSLPYFPSNLPKNFPPPDFYTASPSPRPKSLLQLNTCLRSNRGSFLRRQRRCSARGTTTTSSPLPDSRWPAQPGGPAGLPRTCHQLALPVV